MISVNVPDSSWSENRTTFSGQFYNLVFRFNTRDERWRVDLYKNDQPIIQGIKIMENQTLFGRYILNDFPNGDIACLRMKNDGLPAGRNNVGTGLPYQLIYLTDAEIDEIIAGA